MRPKKGTHLFTLKERILLHLMEHHAVREYDIPHALTQDGIAEAQGIRRGNTSRYLQEMREAGMIDALRARPRGRKMRTKYYVLTEKGRGKVRALLERANEARIRLIYPHEELEVVLRDVQKLIPGEPSLSELDHAISYGRLDVPEFMERRLVANRAGYRCSPEMPKAEMFYGREEELEQLGRWGRSRDSAVLMITGVAGIGKTTLLAKASEEWLGVSHVFWHRVREYDTTWSIVHNLGAFLSGIGKSSVQGVLSGHEVDIGALSYALSKDVKEKRLICVFDDLHSASEEVLRTIRLLADSALHSKGLKLAVASRGYIKLTDRRAAISGAFLELRLKGLAPAAAMYLLPSSVMPYTEEAGMLIKATGGHPFLLKHMVPGLSEDVELSRYVREEVIAGLSEDEMNVLRYLSLLRRPIYKASLVHDLGLDPGAIETLEERGLLSSADAGGCEIHDLLKESVGKRIDRRTKQTIHNAIGEMYASNPTGLWGTEALYHYVEASAYMKGVEILLASGREIIAMGLAPSVSAQVRVLWQKHEPPKEAAAIFYTLVGEIFEQAGDWDAAAQAYERAESAGDGDSSLVKALVRLGEMQLLRGALEASERLLKDADRLGGKIKDIEGRGDAKYALGNFYLFQGKIDDALAMFEEGRTFAKKAESKRLEGKCLYGIGRVEHTKGDVKQAIQTKIKAAEILEVVGEKVELSKVLTSIGGSYFEVKDLKSALKYHEQALKMTEEMGNPRLIGYALSNAAGVLLELSNYEKAGQYLERALEIFESLGEKGMVASVCNNISNLLRQTKRLDEALKYASRSIEEAVNSGVKHQIARAEGELGVVLMALGQFSDAEKHLSNARRIAIEIHDNRLKNDMERDLQTLARSQRGVK
ncbi:MAG: tetratricopeptide repeat protein [Candidatus Thermoplasmatota archaeon]